jgi:hypothetical protein
MADLLTRRTSLRPVMKIVDEYLYGNCSFEQMPAGSLNNIPTMITEIDSHVLMTIA